MNLDGFHARSDEKSRCCVSPTLLRLRYNLIGISDFNSSARKTICPPPSPVNLRSPWTRLGGQRGSFSCSAGFVSRLQRLAADTSPPWITSERSIRYLLCGAVSLAAGQSSRCRSGRAVAGRRSPRKVSSTRNRSRWRRRRLRGGRCRSAWCHQRAGGSRRRWLGR